MNTFENVSVDSSVNVDAVVSVEADASEVDMVSDAIVNADMQDPALLLGQIERLQEQNSLLAQSVATLSAQIETAPAAAPVKEKKARKASKPRVLAVSRPGRRSKMALVDYVVRAIGTSEGSAVDAVAAATLELGYVSTNPEKHARTVLALVYQNSYKKFFQRTAEGSKLWMLTEVGLARFNEIEAHLAEVAAQPVADEAVASSAV
jgi:hypothetical protein